MVFTPACTTTIHLEYLETWTDRDTFDKFPISFVLAVVQVDYNQAMIEYHCRVVLIGKDTNFHAVSERTRSQT